MRTNNDRLRDSSPSVITIPLIYFIISFSWIFFSDRLLGSLGVDGQFLTKLQMAKGGFFVIASTLLLYVLMRRFVNTIIKTDETLVVQQKNFELWADNASDIISIHDTQGVFLYVSPSCERLVGYTPEALEGTNCYAYFHPEDVDTISKHLEIPVSDGELPAVEYRFCAKQGSYVWFETSSRVFTVPDQPDVRQVLAISRDVTERKAYFEQLQKSEERYRCLIDNITDTVWRIDLNGHFLFVSRSAKRTLGYDSEELVGTSIERILTPASYAKAAESLMKRRRGELEGLLTEMELELQGKDGNVIVAETRSTAIHGSSGGVEEIVGVSRDITANKKAETLLRESEARLAQAQEIAHVGHWVSDYQSGEILWSDEVFRIFGLEKGRTTVAYETFINLVHAEDRERVRDTARFAIEQRQPYRLDHRIIRPGGEVRYVHEEAQVMYDDDGRALRMMGIIHDTTELKIAEEAIKQIVTSTSAFHGERFFEAMVKELLAFLQADCVFIGELAGVDLDRVRIVSHCGKIDLGERIEFDLTNTPCQQVVDQGIQVYPRDIRTLFPDNAFLRQFKVEGFIGIPLYDAKHRALGIMAAFFSKPFDTTDFASSIMQIFASRVGAEIERLKLESERLRLEDQLQQSQKMEAIGQLAGGVAHDFNNLLTSIMGSCDLLAEDFRGKGLDMELLDGIQKASERAASLTRQLLAFSRKQILEPRILDLNHLIFHLDKMLRRLIGEDVEYITIPEQDIGMVKADPGQIEQIVINLAVNARDAMPQGGKLVVETKNVELDESFCSVHNDVVPGPYVMISVSDDGVGMSKDVRARIFEPFFTTKEKGKGTGLGLSTVYGIVKQSGGSIYVYSEEGKGTAFKIYFPKVDAPQELSVFASSDDTVLHGKETILLVEDDEMVRLFVSQVLQRKGYNVLVAAYPDEAIQIEKNFTDPIDLLLTDVVMPNMSGSELARGLLQNRPAMRTIYMSGYTDDAVVRYGVLEEDLHFLQKPFSSNVLLRSIRGVLDGGGVER